MTYALFVKIDGKWLFQGTNDGLPHEYPIDSFKANVKEDAELTQNMRVKTEGYKIVNLDTDWVDTWLATQVTAKSEQTVVAPMPDKSELSEMLVPGHKYRVEYKSPQLRYSRRIYATYISCTDSTLFFDLRPVSGTTSIGKDWVERLEEVGMGVSHGSERIIR